MVKKNLQNSNSEPNGQTTNSNEPSPASGGSGSKWKGCSCWSCGSEEELKEDHTGDIICETCEEMMNRIGATCMYEYVLPYNQSTAAMFFRAGYLT